MHYIHAIIDWFAGIFASEEKTTLKVTGSAVGAVGSLVLPNGQSLMVFLGFVGLGIGAMIAGIISQVSKAYALKVVREANAHADALEITAKAEAAAFLIHADAHKGTCEELLEKTKKELAEMVAYHVESKAERKAIVDEVERLRQSVCELSNIVLERAGFTTRIQTGPS